MEDNKFKKGAASFYIVAFAALILVIIASSFAAVAVSEMGRISNSDLSRSAYDAAMAGVEDAKLALFNYQSCLEQGYTYTGVLSGGEDGTVSCEDIIYYMENPDCDMVAHILGRPIDSETNEVMISEGSKTSNNMEQAYTCVKIETKLLNYQSELGSTSSYKIVNVSPEDKSKVNEIKYVKLSWGKSEDRNYRDFSSNGETARVTFEPVDPKKGVSDPPTLAFQLVQTATRFKLQDVNAATTKAGETDRATVFLVPTGDQTAASGSNETYVGAYDGSANRISAKAFADTNYHEKNYPYAVYCGDSQDSEFACSVTIGIPRPIGGDRNADTFMFVVSLPYGQPETEFALKLCTDENSCSDVEDDFTVEDDNRGVVSLGNMQIAIDSTGRANDLYRRVRVTVEKSSEATYLPYAIQADDDGGSGNGAGIWKELHVSTDYGQQ